jgi:hypothetical protein
MTWVLGFAVRILAISSWPPVASEWAVYCALRGLTEKKSVMALVGGSSHASSYL